MNKTKEQKQQALMIKLTDYWGLRAITQIRYLEELVKYGYYADTGLAEHVTEWLHNRYHENGAVGKQDVAKLESMLAPASLTAKSLTVSCVGHAHIDMNWMWAFDETVIITIETFRTMLQLMKEYPEFTFMQSQASVYKIIEEFAPELLPEIIQRIQEGRWEVTASTWVETDKNLPDGESLTRHLLYTKRYLKKLLGLSEDDFRIDFEPDTFGHTAQVPEILSSGGVKYYYHCRGYQGHSLYRWEALSGAQVTVLREPIWYNEQIDTESFLYIPGYCKTNGIDRFCHVYGVGDHGGGATRRDIDRILDMASWPCMPALGFGRLIDFFVSLDTKELPVVTGELNYVFDGCYTTQTRIKKANRMAEKGLNAAETLNVFSQLCGAYRYSAEHFADAWENVLFSHFHDIIPGSGVIGTRDYAMGMFQRTMGTVGARTSGAARALAGCINTAVLLPQPENEKDSFSEGGGVGFGAPDFHYTAAAGFTGGERRLFTVFNPTDAEYNGAVELTVWDWPFSPDRALLRDETGTALAMQLIDTSEAAFWAHKLFRMLVVLKVPAFGYRTVLLEENNISPGVRVTTHDPRVDNIPEYSLENRYIKAQFDPSTMMLVSLIDQETGVELAGGMGGFYFSLEDTEQGMTSWRTGRPFSVAAVSDNVRIRGRVCGPVRNSITYECSVAGSRMVVTVSLDDDARTLRYDVNCMWREIGSPEKGVPQLRFCLPTALHCDHYLYDGAFSTLTRPPMNRDVPAHSYAFAPYEKCGMMLVTDSKYGFKCQENELSVTLIRSSFDPDNLPEIYDHTFSIGIAVLSTSDELALRHTSTAFCVPPQVVATSSHTGVLPLSGQLLSVTGSAAVSCVKMDEEGQGNVIIRLYETMGKTGEVVLTWFKEPEMAAYVDTHEKDLNTAVPMIQGCKVIAVMRPYAVTALRIRFCESAKE